MKREAREVQVKIFKWGLSQQSRANEAEKNLREIACFIIALVAGGILTVDYERFGRFMEKLREYRSGFGTTSQGTFH